ncbi:hypothetical protein FO519_002835 [Halicephalobus sp. NKZ332]|nr:hypothetical protein FO519_002835 [Halicephalobus sp. NKZ332]
MSRNISKKEFWQECRDWLMNVGALERDIKCNELEELGMVLKDGIRLCYLINILKDESIEKGEIYFNNSDLSYVRQKNNHKFLEACRNLFHFNEASLFDPPDLEEFERFEKVLKTISALSRSTEAISKGFRPIPEACPSSKSSSDNNYQYMKKAVGTVDAKQYRAIFLKMENSEEAKVYKKIVVEKEIPEDIWKSFESKSLKEQKIKELLKTEISYLKNCLELLVKNLRDPLEECIQSLEVIELFSSIQKIYQLHEELYRELRKAALVTFGIEQKSTEEEEISIGKVFLNNKNKFIAYGEYCVYINSVRTLLKLKQNTDPSIKNKINELMKGLDFEIGDLLIVPRQRISNYHLILKEILETTNNNDPEKMVLQRAWEAFEDLNNYIGRFIADTEHVNVIKQMEEDIVDIDDCGSRGTLVKGELNIEKFEDTICENGGLSPSGNLTITRRLIPNFLENNSLKLVKRSRHGKRDHVLQIMLKSKKEKDKWKEKIQSILERSNPPVSWSCGHNLCYKTFNKITECDICHNLLLGKFFQGYKCKNCKKNIHYECLPNLQCEGQLPQPMAISAMNLLRVTSNSEQSRRSSANSETLLEPFSEQGTYKAIETFESDDPEFLSFQEGDEIIACEESETTLFGRRKALPGKSGIILKDKVEKLSVQLMTFRGQSVMSDAGNGEHRNNHGEPSTSIHQEVIESSEASGLKKYSWYFCDMNRKAAEKCLAKQSNGTYLVRYSKKEKQCIISVIYEHEPRHIKINQCDREDSRIFRLVFYSYLDNFNITSASDFPGYKEAIEKIAQEQGIPGIVSICKFVSILNSRLSHMEECLDYDFVAEALGLQHEIGIVMDYFMDLGKWRYACGPGYSSMIL